MTKPTIQASPTELASQLVAALLRREAAMAESDEPLFTLNGGPVTPGELGHPDCLLPVIVWHAERLNQYGMNNKDALAASYPKNSGAFMGRSVSLEGFTGATAEALLFIMESFHGIRENSPRNQMNGVSAELDQVVAEFRDAHPAPAATTVVPGRPDGLK